MHDSTNWQAPPPPPPYATHQRRPATLWKLFPSEFRGCLDPYAPLSLPSWGRADGNIEWEMDLSDKHTFLQDKFPFTRGKTGSQPPSYVYTSFPPTISKVGGGVGDKVFMTFKTDKKKRTQKAEMFFNDLPYCTWSNLNEIMSTTDGRTCDDAHFVLTDSSRGVDLASFRWLDERGGFDACMRFLPPFQKSGVTEEIVLFSFLIYLNHCWETMTDESRCTSLQAQLKTMEVMRDTFDQNPGRQRIYQWADSKESIDKFVLDLVARYAGPSERQRPLDLDTAPTTAAVAAATTCC